jgi:hypothetical protein
MYIPIGFLFYFIFSRPAPRPARRRARAHMIFAALALSLVLVLRSLKIDDRNDRIRMLLRQTFLACEHLALAPPGNLKPL